MRTNLTVPLDEQSHTINISSQSIDQLPEKDKHYLAVKSLFLNDNNIQKLPGALLKNRTLVYLNWSNNNLSKFPKKVCKIKSLNNLDLSRNGITTVPKEISSLFRLMVLDLSRNKIQKLPTQIKDLRNLILLSLSENKLAIVPNAIYSIKTLRKLDLSKNLFTSIPPRFRKLKNLTELDLSSNSLTHFFTISLTSQLSKVETLLLNGNQIAKVNGSISKLISLKKLDLRTNNIMKISKKISRCVKLQTLLLDRNNLSGLPSLRANTQLAELSLSENNFYRLDPQIYKTNSLVCLRINDNKLFGISKLLPNNSTLEKIQILNLCNNKIVAIDDNFFHQNSNLEQLSLENNNLISVPNSMFNLQFLQILKLSRNRLSELPSNFGLLGSNLKQLDLSFNSFTHFPIGITECKNLEQLRLISNQINEIPHQIENCTQLILLNLSSNKFKAFPIELFSLVNLSFLFLGNCLIDTIPDGIASLKKLEELNLNSNRITNISNDIGSLKALIKINLSNNQISKIPNEFFNLNSNYTDEGISVDLSNNHLIELHPNWKKFTRLRLLDLSHNSISKFPPDFFTQYQDLETLKISYNNAKNLNLTNIFLLPSLRFLHTEGNNYNLKFKKFFINLYNFSKRIKKVINPHKINFSSKDKKKMYFLKNIHQLQEFFVNSDLKTDFSKSISNNRKEFNFGYSETIGRRNKMEDSIDIKIGFGKSNKNALFALYDGHGGRKVANYLSNNLLEVLIKELYKLNSTLSDSGTNLESGSDLMKNSILKNITNSEDISNPINGANIGKSTDLSNRIDVKCEIETKKETGKYNEPGTETGMSTEIDNKNQNDNDGDSCDINKKGNKLFATEKTKKVKNNPNSDYLKKYSIKKSSSENTLKNLKYRKLNSKKTQSQIITRNSKREKQYFIKNKQKNETLNNLKKIKNINEIRTKIYKKIKKVFQETNQKLKDRNESSGSTAVVALILDNHLYCANLGDSRAIISKNKMAIRLTFDHKPNVLSERRRIIAKGGYVNEEQRVNSHLAISRSFGDFHVGDCISSKPHLSSIKIGSQNEVLILACDGVWDVLLDQEVIDIALQFNDPHEAALKIRNLAENYGSTDNISVIVIYFNKFNNLKTQIEKEKRRINGSKFKSNHIFNNNNYIVPKLSISRFDQEFIFKCNSVVIPSTKKKQNNTKIQKIELTSDEKPKFRKYSLAFSNLEPTIPLHCKIDHVLEKKDIKNNNFFHKKPFLKKNSKLKSVITNLNLNPSLIQKKRSLKSTIKKKFTFQIISSHSPTKSEWFEYKD
ncbi:leucine-rich repeat-containing protein [Anaeramoeba flamelloides]|uniref:Leucine-rich repeat-containing protein n=1 Tax=Anaeramoeba flamelloides TaxID=1746091 RepID=A0AAV7ZNX1_9EUKA|nr:leucine-rich repeat-containing protein [Anaeramoeba flamelloides]